MSTIWNGVNSNWKRGRRSYSVEISIIYFNKLIILFTNNKYRNWICFTWKWCALKQKNRPWDYVFATLVIGFSNNYFSSVFFFYDWCHDHCILFECWMLWRWIGFRRNIKVENEIDLLCWMCVLSKIHLPIWSFQLMKLSFM